MPRRAIPALTLQQVMRKVAITLAFATILAAGTALACRCVQYASAADHLREADVMFVGRAEESVARDEDGLSLGLTRFAVQTTIKGNAQAVRSVVHDTEPTACGVTFVPGRTYTILASWNDGRLVTGSCSRPQFPLGDYVRAAGAR